MKHLDVYDTVVKMKYQGVLVQTPEQYFDIFKCLRDEVTTRKEQGYYDLSARNYNSDREEDNVYYEGQNDYSYDQGGDEYNNYRGGEKYNYYQGDAFYKDKTYLRSRYSV